MQEALTNVRRHAGPVDTVAVRLTIGADNVTIEVSDNGRGAGAATSPDGFGIIGMRERVAAVGGTVRGRAATRRRLARAGSPPARRRGRATVEAGAARVIRVMLVDDQEMVRVGFRMILQAEPDLTIVGEAADGAGCGRARRIAPPRT